MANNKSAEKRQRQNEKRRQQNKALKTRIKSLRKEIREFIDDENTDRAREMLDKLYGVCDRAAKKGAIHTNKASRIKSRVTQKVNQADESAGE